jgi:hypothetical protein
MNKQLVSSFVLAFFAAVAIAQPANEPVGIAAKTAGMTMLDGRVEGNAVPRVGRSGSFHTRSRLNFPTKWGILRKSLLLKSSSEIHQSEFGSIFGFLWTTRFRNFKKSLPDGVKIGDSDTSITADNRHIEINAGGCDNAVG